MSAKAAPAPIDRGLGPIFSLLTLALGLGFISVVMPRIAVHELSVKHYRSEFRVAASWPVLGNIYDLRSVWASFAYYPRPKEDLVWREFLPQSANGKVFTAAAVPAYSNLLRNTDIGLGLVILSAVLVPFFAPGRRASELYGSARFQSFPTRFSSSLRRSSQGIVLGQHHGQVLIHSGVENVLVLGPPGEGKTFGNAIPTLRVSWPWSAIVFDPTYEIYAETAKERAAFGKVFLFDPTSPKTHRFNPLAGISADDIDRIKRVLTPLFDTGTQNGGDDQYFRDRATVIATAACAFLIENGQPELASVLAFVRNPQWKSATEPFEVMRTSAIPYVQQVGAEFATMTDKTRAPLVSTFTDIFEVFATQNVEKATSASDFSAGDFEHAAVSLYLVVREADSARFAPLMRLVLARVLDDLMLEKPKPDRPRTLLLIDELPLLQAPFIEKKLATMRKYRITAALLAQTLSQITRIYGPNQSVVGTCDVKVLYATEDQQTQELGERLLGTKTQFDRGYESDGTPSASREQRRPLMFGHEFAMLRNRVLITKKGERPIQARKLNAAHDKRFFRKTSRR